MSGLLGNLYDKFFTAEGLQQTMADPRFQMGVGLLGRTDMPFGQALGGTMNDMAAQQMLQQEFKAQQQAHEQQMRQQAAQQQLMQQNPKLAPYLQAYPSAAPAILGSVFRNPTDAPSNVREWEYFTRLTPEEKKQYLTMKRANQVLDRGSEYYIPDPANPGVASATVPKDLAPEDRPETRAAQAAAVESAKGSQQTQSELSTRMARLPGLLTLVDELSELGRKATYTKAGQVYDAARTQLGVEPREAAVARAEYISKVDNEILPLLRETFGSQFTEREGQSLKATLGDPDKSPQEKEAVLRSFIAAKLRDIQMLERKAGVKPTAHTAPAMNTTPKIIDFNDLP